MSQTKPSPKTEKPKGFAISPEMRSLGKRFGLDVGAIEKQAMEAKTRLENLEKAVVEIANHIKDSDEKLAPLVNAIEQAEAARTQAGGNPTVAGSNPAMPQGQMNVGSILQLLPQLLSGGGMSDEMQKMNMRMMSMSIDRMQADIGFTEAIKNAIVTKLAGKAAADLGV